MATTMHILAHPNPALKERAGEVDPRSDAALKALAEAMATTMYDAPGVGLAATQVGVQKRLLVCDVEEELIAVCNPVVRPSGDETAVEDEGCLSLPGIVVPVERASAIVCSGLDLEGRPLRIEAEGLLARVLQHETDHLDGVLIIDRAPADERRAALKRYRDQAAG